MKPLPAFVLCLLCLSAVAVADTVGQYTFTLDGKPFLPWLKTTEGEAPVAGDIATIENIPLCLDGPGIYHLERDYDKGLLRRKLEDGRSIIVGCAVSEKREDSPAPTRLKAKPPIINPLRSMSDDEVKSLRGVALEEWPEGIEKDLARLNWEHVSLQIGRGALWAHKDKMPPIPEGVRMLVLDSSGSWQCEDTSGFAALKQLRFLDLNAVSLNKFDFAVLAGMPLQYLSLPSARSDVQHVETLASLVHLKTFHATYCRYLGNASWLGSLPDLRQIDIGHAGAWSEGPRTDLALASLGALAKLVSLNAPSSPIQSLPKVPMPALKNVDVLLSTATPAMIDAFAKANPQAKFLRSMNGELSARLATADRMRARTGGVCHRRTEQEKTIAEIKDRDQLTEIARHFEVVDNKSGGHCMCCGDPSFEFYQGDKLVAMIGFHHARTIRWSDGVWPGDGMLTSRSSEYLVEWLAKQGYTKPKDDVVEARRQQAATTRRFDRYKALLPPALHEALTSAQSLNEATAAFEKTVPDAAARARLYLKLYGCDDCTWALSTGYDQPLQKTWLPGIPAPVLHTAIREAAANSEEGQGACRWVFGDQHTDEWKDEPEQVERLTRFALTHPRQGNRWRTLAVLRDLGTPKAVELLREVMKQGTKPRTLSADEQSEAGGQRTFFPNTIPFPDGTADSVAAALCLAMLKDEPSTAEVARIRDGLSAEVRKKWDEELARK